MPECDLNVSLGTYNQIQLGKDAPIFQTLFQNSYNELSKDIPTETGWYNKAKDHGLGQVNSFSASSLMFQAPLSISSNSWSQPQLAYPKKNQ